MKKTELYFDSIAEDFENRMNKFDLHSRLNWFKEKIKAESLKGRKLLDVGAGLGHFSMVPHNLGVKVTPLDISLKLVKILKVQFPDAVCGTALDLPFPDNVFDCVISSECIEHTPDPVKATKEMIRVLKPEGRLYLTTPNFYWRWTVTVAEFLGLRSFRGIENWISRKKMKETFLQCRAEILQDEGLYIFPFQFKIFHPIIRFINLRGQIFRPLMINQCWVIKK